MIENRLCKSTDIELSLKLKWVLNDEGHLFETGKGEERDTNNHWAQNTELTFYFGKGLIPSYYLDGSISSFRVSGTPFLFLLYIA